MQLGIEETQLTMSERNRMEYMHTVVYPQLQ